MFGQALHESSVDDGRKLVERVVPVQKVLTRRQPHWEVPNTVSWYSSRRVHRLAVEKSLDKDRRVATELLEAEFQPLET
jgi:hypothetical protein